MIYGGLQATLAPALTRALCSSRVSLATKASAKAFFDNSIKHRAGGDTNNIQSETNRLEKTQQKFWEKAGAVFNEDTRKWEIKLDSKTIKTPLGFPMALPENKKQLAYLIGHEWDTLTDAKVKPNTLPLTSMASRAVDLNNVFRSGGKPDPELAMKIGDLQDVKVNMLRYLDTDTCLIFTTKDEYAGKLRTKQEELYLPLIEEHNDFFTAFARKNGFLPSEDYKVELETLDCETQGLIGNSQLVVNQGIVLSWLDRLPLYDLVALEKAILTSKSFLCGVSVLRSNSTDEQLLKEVYQVNKSSPDDHFYRSVEEVRELGDLETIFQTEEWGEVEDTHDVDQVDWIRNLSAAALVCR